MGCAASYERIDAAAEQLYSAMLSGGSMPDIGLEPDVETFLGLESNQALVTYHNKIAKDLQARAPEYVNNALRLFGGLTNIPNAVGLASLLIYMVLNIAASMTKGQNDVKNIVRSIFADEKVSEIGNLMETFTDRFLMYANSSDEVLKVTKTYEDRLHHQLNRVKNSMLKDGHVNNRAVKHWMNGAALHVGMLIYMAKQETVHKTAASLAIITYQGELDEILQKYKAYKPSTLSCGDCLWGPKRRKRLVIQACDATISRCTDKEAGWTLSLQRRIEGACDSYIFTKYTDIMFARSEQIKKMKEFFSNTYKNLDKLIKEKGIFKLRSLVF